MDSYRYEIVLGKGIFTVTKKQDTMLLKTKEYSFANPVRFYELLRKIIAPNSVIIVRGKNGKKV